MAEEATSTKESRFNLVLTLGLAASITSLFGSFNEVIKDRHEIRVQQCDLAEKIVLGSPAGQLAPDPVKRHLVLGAYERLDICLRR